MNFTICKKHCIFICNFYNEIEKELTIIALQNCDYLKHHFFERENYTDLYFILRSGLLSHPILGTQIWDDL